MTHPTRERIVAATTELLRRQGFTGTGLKQIVAEAGAPFGSLYHFFPAGKDQLGAEVIRRAGADYQALVESVFDAAPDYVTGVRHCFDGAAELLRQTDFADACPIETVALEVASTNDALREACASVFEAWIAAAVQRGQRAGLPADKARELAIVFISALEGAFVLSRTLRDAEHVQIAGRHVAAAVEAALYARAKPRPQRTAAGKRAKKKRT